LAETRQQMIEETVTAFKKFGRRLRHRFESRKVQSFDQAVVSIDDFLRQFANKISASNFGIQRKQIGGMRQLCELIGEKLLEDQQISLQLLGLRSSRLRGMRRQAFGTDAVSQRKSVLQREIFAGIS